MVTLTASLRSCVRLGQCWFAGWFNTLRFFSNDSPTAVGGFLSGYFANQLLNRLTFIELNAFAPYRCSTICRTTLIVAG